MSKKISFEKEKHLLNNETMDTLHKEFIDIFNSIEILSSENFINKLSEILAHTKKHFSIEEEFMDKTSYPSIKEHKDEHNKVLAEMQYFLDNTNSNIGKKMLKAYYLEKLPEWFDLHLLSMDSDLAAHLKDIKLS